MLTNNTQFEVKSVGEHLIVYYDYGRVLRDRGDTFRLTYRKDRNRGTYKVTEGKEGVMRVFPYPYMERLCWVRVTRTRALLEGIPVEIDECKIPLLNGSYKKESYYEVEIEDTVPSTEWIDKMKTLGMFEESLKNKYQTVYDIVYG